MNERSETRPTTACERARLAIHAATDGVLGADEARGLDAHLAGCADCRRYREEIEAVSRRLRQAPLMKLPDRALDAVWRQTVGLPRAAPETPGRSSAGVRHSWRRRAWASLAAAATLVAAIALWQVGSIAPAGARHPLDTGLDGISPEVVQAAADLRLALRVTDAAVHRAEVRGLRGAIDRGLGPALDRTPLFGPALAGASPAPAKENAR